MKPVGAEGPPIPAGIPGPKEGIISASRRVPGGLLGMLALVFLVEGFIGGHGKSFRHPWAWDWYLADRAARKKVQDCEVLCFGDSLMKFGVAPRVICREAGWEAYNLAVGVGQPSSSYFLLRRALEAGARPKAVLIDTVPHGLAEPPHANASLWPELLSDRDCLELSLAARDPDFFTSMTLARAFASIRDRAQVRGAIAASLDGQTSPTARALPPYLRNWAENRGAQLTRRPPTSVPNPIEAWGPWLLPDSWRPSELNSRFLHEFFRLAAAKGIRAYWLLPPLDPEVQSRREAKGRDAEYAGFVESVRAEHPEVVILDARHSGYGPEAHIDPIHLDVRGAASLSRDIAALLRRDPSNLARWEILPAFRDLPAEVALEDVGQSAEFVARKARR